MGMPPLPAPGSPAAKLREARFAFFIFSGFAVAFFGMALALGTEPRMLLERTGERVFRVTGSNHYFGHQFFSRTIEGVEGFRLADNSRKLREDSIKDRQRRARQKRLAFTDAKGWELSWGRVDDSRVIDDFMRGDATTLALADPPPWWRVALTCLCLAMGGLLVFNALKRFFPKKEEATAWS